MQAQPADPSFHVHNQLLPHLHLLSTYPLPQMQRIGLDQVIHWLTQAPQISREMKPMNWTYLHPPPDGSMFLAWQPPRMQLHFASDGYIWLDTESSFRQQINGFHVEILVHRAGYVYGQEQVTAHQRVRYRIAAKDPPQQAQIDPNFWLIHYGPSDPQFRQPVNRVPIHPHVQNLMRERLYLEQQGAILQRKEFMLMDRANWPTVNANQRMQPPQVHPAYQANPMMARQQAQHYPQAAAQPPAAKKARIDGPAQAITRNAMSEAVLEEDMLEYGDFFDTLTPAEISKMRFKQHHQWMEEIYSSVYSLSQIVPEDLGLGLTGTLKELTDGIFEAPDPVAAIELYPPPTHPDEANQPPQTDHQPAAGFGAYQKLAPEKMADFERRIAEFVEKGNADIQAMKKQHAETVAQFNKSKTYMKAERKLRDGKGDEIDLLVADLEGTLGAKVEVQKLMTCVDEGGLEKEDKSRVVNGSGNGNGASTTQSNTNAASNDYNSNGSANSNGHSIFDAEDNSAANLLDEFGNGSFTNSPAARIGTPGISQPRSGVPTPGPAAGGPSTEFLQPGEQEHGPDDSGLDLLEAIDMDVDMGGLDANEAEQEAEATKAGAEEDWVIVGGEQAHPTAPTSESKPAEVPVVTTAEVAKPAVSAPESTESLSTSAAVPVSTTAEAPSATDTPNEAGASLFDGADFGNTFEGIDTDDLGLDLGGGDFADEAFGAGADDSGT